MLLSFLREEAEGQYFIDLNYNVYLYKPRDPRVSFVKFVSIERSTLEMYGKVTEVEA
ncbi:hypothetical protein [Enterococcus phage vB_EfaP_Efmus1]|uniref:Uncharacterized protein n=1 Tax=Enterococcus phage vB_EfaP_Efmus1 TaxID=2546625 RepID=A0A4D6DTC6_9CAUD|nr:hypothetical protein H3T71_gp09 [Enterococcus phage vB_EfaP_Efmus1]QBZ69504.1 hypothetical protein [Enterococcus phage vB_EfaP_Efmus1]